MDMKPSNVSMKEEQMQMFEHEVGVSKIFGLYNSATSRTYKEETFELQHVT
jgi:hypothetical protein